MFVPKPVRRRQLLRLSFRRGGTARTVALPVPNRLKIDLRHGKHSCGGDDAVNQLVARRLLEKLGCTVEVVPNGREACLAITRKNYDLVFMDGHMPVMDGIEATRSIRSEQVGKTRVPIIALTASAQEDNRQNCFEAGMDDFVAKPMVIADLRHILNCWLPTAQTKQ